MKISVVASMFQSECFIVEFIDRILCQIKKFTDDFEIILVDDGSPDNSLLVAKDALIRIPQLKIIELSKNFGHGKAMMTGLEYATGDLVFLIDIDLEEPPELFEVFYKKLVDDNLDAVLGQQIQRKGNFLEKYGGAVAWKLIELCLPMPVPKNLSTVRLMKRQFVSSFIKHKEHKTAIGGLFILTGYKQGVVQFTKESKGTTSYSFKRRVLMFIESITSFSEVPLYLIFYLGSAILLTSTIVGVYLVFRAFTGTVMSGWSSTMLSIWFLGGLIMFGMGVVGLYVARIFVETKGRPYTIIREIYTSSVK
jgi:putative glycosyltransferase